MHSGVCAGWGWGESSFVRNIRVDNNSITKPMQRLADGGGVYTNTPCPDCHVSGNYFASDPAPYGCLYHDGGSGLWNDVSPFTMHGISVIVPFFEGKRLDLSQVNNVFNHITSHIAFAHGGSRHTTINKMW